MYHVESRDTIISIVVQAKGDVDTLSHKLMRAFSAVNEGGTPRCSACAGASSVSRTTNCLYAAIFLWNSSSGGVFCKAFMRET